MAIGLFFAFWSWVGFETTAVYGEESRNPKKIVPRATIIAVIGLGPVLHVHLGDGDRGQRQRRHPSRPRSARIRSTCSSSWWTPTWAAVLLDIYKILLVIGSFACAMAFHNAASRYLFALGREIPSDRSARRPSGGTTRSTARPTSRRRCRASSRCVIVLLFAFFTAVQVPDANGNPVDTPTLVPYVNIYGLLALIGTAAILLVQAICSAAVIWYFWVQEDAQGQRDHHADLPADRRRRHALRRLAAVGQPCLRCGLRGELGCLQSRPVHDPGGVRRSASGTRCGCGRPSRTSYAEIGRTVLDEAHERAEEAPSAPPA